MGSDSSKKAKSLQKKDLPDGIDWDEYLAQAQKFREFERQRRRQHRRRRENQTAAPGADNPIANEERKENSGPDFNNTGQEQNVDTNVKEDTMDPQEPQNTRELMIEWDKNIIGQAKAKQAIEQMFFFPRRFPKFFRRDDNNDNENDGDRENNSSIIGSGNAVKDSIARSRCILFWGPPGTGKTSLARSLATAHKAKLIDCAPNQILDKYVGVSEKILSEKFAIAKNSKCVILIDEIDSFGRQRDEKEKSHERSLKNTLLQCIENFERGMKVDSALIACTNFFDQLDSALLRRFTSHVFCGLPSEEERYQILCHFLKNFQTEMDEEELRVIARNTDCYSGSDLQTLVRNASNQSINDLYRATHFIQTADGLKPCSETTLGAKKLNLYMLEDDVLAPQRAIIFNDFVRALKESRPNINRLEYEKYLRLAKCDKLENNQEAKKSPLEVECEDIFHPRDTNEAKMGEMLIFRQIQRYIALAGNPQTKVGASAQTWLISVVVTFAPCFLFIPSILWYIITFFALVELFSTVVMPLCYVMWDSVWNSTDMQQAIISHSLNEICGFCVLIIIAARGCQYLTTNDRLYASNVVVEWYFSITFIRLASQLINFFVLRKKSGMQGDSVFAAAIKEAPQMVLEKGRNFIHNLCKFGRGDAYTTLNDELTPEEFQRMFRFAQYEARGRGGGRGSTGGARDRGAGRGVGGMNSRSTSGARARFERGDSDTVFTGGRNSRSSTSSNTRDHDHEDEEKLPHLENSNTPSGGSGSQNLGSNGYDDPLSNSSLFESHYPDDAATIGRRRRKQSIFEEPPPDPKHNNHNNNYSDPLLGSTDSGSPFGQSGKTSARHGSK